MTSSMILSGLKVNGDDKREARKMREKERDMEEEGKKEGGGGGWLEWTFAFVRSCLSSDSNT